MEKSNGGNTGAANTQTESMGTANPINIIPSYIIIKLWKRLT